MNTKIQKETSLGMGAIVENGLTTFRVWAPNAESVHVQGEFNNWENSGIELAQEGNGYWAIATDKISEGEEYKYVISNDGSIYFKNDPYSYEVTNSNGNSIVKNLNFDWSKDDFKMRPWNELVIYELHVGTFNRKLTDTVGRFEQVIEKLDYLLKLGINCIELLPIAEFAGDISWGYNPAYPFAIEQDYGGPEAFANLVKEAHKRGIAVIMDVVYNHFGPSDMDLWQFDGWSENEKGGIYFYNDYKSKTPWGDTRPDYGRAEVRQYIRDNAFMWIEKYNCDGLRLDATSYIRYDRGGLGDDLEIAEGIQMVRDINREIAEKYPNVLMIAEDLKGDDRITQKNGSGLSFGSQWDMNFFLPVREVIQDTNDEGRDIHKIVNALEFKHNEDVFERVIYTESHDEVANGKARVPEEIEPGNADSVFAKKRALLGILLTLTAPGIPMIFQGQEFAEDGYFQDTEELDWKKLKENDGIKNLVADAIALRIGTKGKTFGLRDQIIHFGHINNDTKILSYIRGDRDGNEPVLIVMNFSNQVFTDYKIGLDYEEKWQLALNSSFEGYDDSFEKIEVNDLKIIKETTDGKEWTGAFNIPSYTCLIYTK